MMDERDTIWVLSTRQWYDTWLSGQARHEHSPRIRHIDGLGDCYGIVIRPNDRVVYGDVSSWPWSTRRVIAESLALAKLAGDKLGRKEVS